MTTFRLVMPEDMNNFHADITFVRVDAIGNKQALREGGKA